MQFARAVRLSPDARPLSVWNLISAGVLFLLGQTPTLGSNFMHNEGRHVVETAVNARAGFLDRPTLIVLIVSTGLIIGLFGLFGLFTH